MSAPPKPTPLTRADLLIEAMLTVGELRKPGYVNKVLDQLMVLETEIDEGRVHVLRPAWTDEEREQVRQDAEDWLREASVRVRARASARKRRSE
ncbi:hypothetical protein V7S57_02295 [Caulobacter sp. CCNWLY153]|uniref:hypothetical protein n=1 Tax=unclassified Caulobacter TaxID=2648921 RepID=UPI002FEE6808